MGIGGIGWPRSRTSRHLGNIDKALKGIKLAATPPTVSQDFVKTILKIQGGSGNQMTAYLRKIGFAGTDGAPTEIYKKFRNEATEGQVAYEALRFGYKPVYVRNEYMHDLDDAKLRGLVVEETGEAQDANVVTMIVSCIKAIKKFAKPAPQAEGKADKLVPLPPQKDQNPPPKPDKVSRTLGMNLSYTINLNLPATTDVAVFNAIFKSLKENLLKDSDA